MGISSTPYLGTPRIVRLVQQAAKVSSLFVSTVRPPGLALKASLGASGTAEDRLRYAFQEEERLQSDLGTTDPFFLLSCLGMSGAPFGLEVQK